MRLYLIRHAEPDYPNNTITAAGHQEAEALAERLAADGITKIYCSPLGRAVHTMQYTAQRLGLEAIIAPWTAELPTNDTDIPPWGRIPVWDIPGEVLRARLGADNRIDCNPSLDVPHVREIYARIERDSDAFLTSLGYEREVKRYRVVRPNRDRVAVFCHAGFGLTWLAHLLELPLPLVWSGFWLAPSSVTTIILEQRSEAWAVPRCLALGDTSHLHTAALPLSPMGQYAINW